ncbi:MAG: homoserine O-acetyltransferase [Elainella sp. Prado103]|nr:homoserine O-acetyltransferase [Elainella sp. Prado103]
MKYQSFVSPHTQFYQLTEPFQLESGDYLEQVQVAYRSWGTLNAAGDNAVLICHALTGNADADDWWAPLFGPGCSFDPTTDFILCSNVLGSCYGTTGPTSLDPRTGATYALRFPAITIRDMVHLQAQLLTYLGIRRIKQVVGGSLGGMQVLEWALLYPEWVESIAVIAASGRHSAWCIGLSETQRQAIYADPNWNGGRYNAENLPVNGLAVARMIAMSTYRSWFSFEEKFSRKRQDDLEQPYAIASYLHHQGQKLVERFDANTYIRLTEAMDSHDIGRDRGDYTAILQRIEQPALIVAIESDVLYPPIEQQQLAAGMPRAQLHTLASPHGHDGFLIDMHVLNDVIVTFSRQWELLER